MLELECPRSKCKFKAHPFILAKHIISKHPIIARNLISYWFYSNRKELEKE